MQGFSGHRQRLTTISESLPLFTKPHCMNTSMSDKIVHPDLYFYVFVFKLQMWIEDPTQQLIFKNALDNIEAPYNGKT